MRRFTRLLCTSLAVCSVVTTAVPAEDGYDLWLRYAALEPGERAAVAARVTAIVAPGRISPTRQAALDELARGFESFLGAAPPFADEPQQGALVVATPAQYARIAELDLTLEPLGEEGYLVRQVELDGRDVTLVTANTDTGLLYGAFALLRHVDVERTLDRIDQRDAPRVRLRLLNHWDNLDRSVERGYAGRSLWDWMTLPEYRNPRYVDYARANASIGINGAVLNNVNASADILTAPYLEKVAALADVLRPYGIRVYLSARFSAPIDAGDLGTADPLDPAVRRWWSAKANEMYALIPDFGGFLVKASSEGQPGPGDYGRTHADGANMLAEALAPHDGVVMWRAFVYSDSDPTDRAKQAYDEFVPLDGRFASNVILQVKNGPIDFQPREPFHPLFGAMPETPLALELQITKEYLGFASHLVYLGPLYEEVLQADTYAAGQGSTIARIVDGSLHGHTLTAMAGVANTGDERDWTGSPFNQANWYAYGRLAWDPDLDPERIAREWLTMTFSRDPAFVAAATAMMRRSREAPVDYMTPLGLTHLMATGHHYGPGPWVADLARPEWNPIYYHRADADGIGFDRTSSGSNAVEQYAAPVAARFSDRGTVGDEYLLWFHRLGWDERLASGRTLWEELVRHYDSGVAEVRSMQREWDALEPYVDAERFAKTAQLLDVQLREAQWWRDACIAYFQSVAQRPLPEGVEPPQYPLAHYEAIRHPYAPN